MWQLCQNEIEVLMDEFQFEWQLLPFSLDMNKNNYYSTLGSGQKIKHQTRLKFSTGTLFWPTTATVIFDCSVDQNAKSFIVDLIS